MKQHKIKFRKAVTLKVIPSVPARKGKPTINSLRVPKGTEVQVDGTLAFVDERLVERCDLYMLGGDVALGVKYADFRFID